MAKEQLKTIEEPVSKQSNGMHINGNENVKKAEDVSLLSNKKNDKKAEKALKVDPATSGNGEPVTEKKSASKKTAKPVSKKIVRIKTTRLIFN